MVRREVLKRLSSEMVTYIGCRNRHRCREQENDRYKRSPYASPPIDKRACFAKIPWSTFELAEEKLADDWDAVRPIQANGTNVKNCGDRDIAAESDEVNQNTQKGVEPHGQDRRARLLPDLVPNMRTGQHLVS